MVCGREKAVLRVARSAATSTVTDVASAARVKERSLRESLAAAPTRGNCAAAAARVAEAHNGLTTLTQSRGLARVCPPPAVRAVSGEPGTRDADRPIRIPAGGAAGWRGRIVDDAGQHPAYGRWVSSFADLADRESVAQEFGAGSACPPAALARMAEDGEVSIRARVARNPRTPKRALALLGADSTSLPLMEPRAVRTYLAENPSTPPAVLKTLAFCDDDETTAKAAAANPALPLDTFEGLTASRESWHRYLAARSDRCPAEMLEDLVADHDEDVVEAAAYNPNCSQNTVEWLAESDWHVMRGAAALHKDCPPDTLETLSHDVEPATSTEEQAPVRLWVAENERCPPEALARLAADSDIRVRSATLKHARCPTQTLAQAAASHNAVARYFAAQNPSTDTATLALLATDAEPMVRAAVAAHDGCPSELVGQLMSDPDAEVQRAAKARHRIAS